MVKAEAEHPWHADDGGVGRNLEARDQRADYGQDDDPDHLRQQNEKSRLPGAMATPAPTKPNT